MAFHRSPANSLFSSQSVGGDSSLSTPAMTAASGKQQSISSSSTFMSATARAARSSGSVLGAAAGFGRGARLFSSPNKKKAETHSSSANANSGGVSSSNFSPSRTSSASNSRYASPIKSSPAFSKSPGKQSSRSPYSRLHGSPAYLSAFADSDDPLEHNFTRVRQKQPPGYFT